MKYNKGPTKLGHAKIASKRAIARLRRMKLMMLTNPPTPATGGFPFYRKGQADE